MLSTVLSILNDKIKASPIDISVINHIPEQNPEDHYINAGFYSTINFVLNQNNKHTRECLITHFDNNLIHYFNNPACIYLINESLRRLNGIMTFTHSSAAINQITFYLPTINYHSTKKNRLNALIICEDPLFVAKLNMVSAAYEINLESCASAEMMIEKLDQQEERYDAIILPPNLSTNKNDLTQKIMSLQKQFKIILLGNENDCHFDCLFHQYHRCQCINDSNNVSAVLQSLLTLNEVE